MRDIKARKADVLAALQQHADMWLSTADPAGRPHLIPVSAWWDGSHLVIATAGACRDPVRPDSHLPEAASAAPMPATACWFTRPHQNYRSPSAMRAAPCWRPAMGWSATNPGR